MKKTGFTLIEVMAVVIIMSFAAWVVSNAFYRFSEASALQRSSEKILSMLAEARGDTLASLNGSQYGVHFENRRAVIFQGPSYNVNSVSNRSYVLEFPIVISLVAISGGNDVLFDRLTGTTSNTGSITISSASDYSKMVTVTIAKSGAAQSK